MVHPYQVILPRGKSGEQLLLEFLDQLGPKVRVFGEIDHICILRRLDYYEQHGPQGRFELIDHLVRLHVDGHLSRYYIAHAVHIGDPSKIFAVSAFYKRDDTIGIDSARSFIRSVLLPPP